MTWTSNLSELNRLFDHAEDAGLVAAAQVGVTATKKALIGGYTSGEFATGESARNVKSSAPYQDGIGRAIRYGTNLLFNLFWELGHHNIFTRKFERVEKWVPTFNANHENMRAAYARAFQRVIDKFRAT
jgi:hypothetical protein